ncbi:hypothetical protein M1146_03920 [Patescibacteria group bacterium]|nr:hypothetical protein [Patescibacteria group bacterium]
MPIGVVEVKKPPTERYSYSVLSNENVLGQLFDYMKQLENFFGLQNIFGIVTDYVSWRICWLDYQNSRTASSRSLPEIRPNHHVPYLCPTKPLRSSNEDDQGIKRELLDSPSATFRRILYGTPLIAYNEPTLIPTLTSVLLKMFYSPVLPTQLIRENKAYIRLDQEGWNWVSLLLKANELDFINFPTARANSFVLLQGFKGGPMVEFGSLALQVEKFVLSNFTIMGILLKI